MKKKTVELHRGEDGITTYHYHNLGRSAPLVKVWVSRVQLPDPPPRIRVQLQIPDRNPA
jgi:hypothetical protein